jgi:hypothetical protein
MIREWQANDFQLLCKSICSRAGVWNTAANNAAVIPKDAIKYAYVT